MSLILLCQTSLCRTSQHEIIGTYSKKVTNLRWKILLRSDYTNESNSIPRNYESNVHLTTTTTNPAQSPTLAPTSASKRSNGDKYSSTAKITVALGVLAIAFIAVVLIVFLCGRYFSRPIREFQSTKSTKVHPTLELRGMDADLLGPSHPPKKLDYSEYLRLRIAMDSYYSANIDQKERERDKMEKDKQDERREQIEKMIAAKINESQSLRSLSSFNSLSASKYRIAEAELLDIESNI